MLRILWTGICCALLWFSFSVIGKNSIIQIGNWVAAKSWVEAPASVVSLELKTTTSTHTDDEGRSHTSTNYDLFTRYVYEAIGDPISNTRVSFATSSDSHTRGYNNKMYQRLGRAKNDGDSISIWYDPDEPRNSVIDRGLRFDALAMSFIFFFLSGGIGFTGLYFQARKLILGDEPSSRGNTFIYSLVILLSSFALLAVYFAVDAVVSGEYKGLAALIFPALILPIWIEYKRYQSRKELGKGDIQNYGTHLYVGIFLLILSLPIAYNEATSLSQYSMVSYLIFCIPALGLITVIHAVFKK